MNSDPDDDQRAADTEAVDKLAEMGGTSKAGWKKRAVGQDTAQALADLPRVGNFQGAMPIKAHRAIANHIADLNMNQSTWVRQAIIEKYLRQGGDPDIGALAADMRIDYRRRDVPRDFHGQNRRRKGRGGRFKGAE